MNDSSFNVVLFGELLMRLETRQQERFVQTHGFDIGFTGGEANAGVVLSQFGVEAYVVAAVPENDLGQACLNHMRRFGLDVRYVARRGGRLGLFFLETGAGHRSSQVLYDRTGSSFSQLRRGDLSWDDILAGKDWLHFTGTAPAISPELAELTLDACRAANRLGVQVSCDVNYRSSLWSEALARETMTRIAPLLDVLIANEEHAQQILGAPPTADSIQDPFDAKRYERTTTFLHETFGLRAAALTVRTGDTANETKIAAFLSDGQVVAMSRTYTVQPLDRIGAGDAFSGALIYALLNKWSAHEAVEFAAAASCFKHAVRGDFSHCSLQEVLNLARRGSAGRVRR